MEQLLTQKDILYRDDDIIVVNKPSGMIVHPQGTYRKKEPALMYEVKELTGLYVYPVHRLDRPVSGAVIFALNKKATRSLQENWTSELMIKEYLTLCRGLIFQEGTFDFPLKEVGKRGRFYKEACTTFSPLQQFYWPEATLCRVRIKTGRRHQIRRHFSRMHYNLIGDTKYGQGSLNIIFRQNFQLPRIFLHAAYLQFPHPVDKRLIEVHCPLPKDLSNCLESLKGGKNSIDLNGI
jgi:tRNA pseudouridine65 synthase